MSTLTTKLRVHAQAGAELQKLTPLYFLLVAPSGVI